MSTLQVANLHFTTTGDQRIEYTGNNVIRVQGKGLVIPKIDSANTPSPEPGMMFYNTSTNNMVMMANTSAVVTIPSNTTVDAAFAVANAGFGKANTSLQNTSGTFAGNFNVTGNVTIANTAMVYYPYTNFVIGEAWSFGAGLALHSSSNGVSRIFFTVDGTDANTGLIRYDHSQNSMQFWTNPRDNNTTYERMRISKDGKVGVNQTTPAEMLSVSGNIRMQAANTRLMGFNSTATYQLNVSGGAAILFNTLGEGSQEIGFETHYSGNSHLERMRINKFGHVTKPYQPFFSAYRNSGQTYTATQTIVWNAVLNNVGNHYNTSTGIFTAPIAGVYIFRADYRSDGTNTGTVFDIVRNDGTTTRHEESSGTSFNQFHQSLSAIYYLNANDYVYCRCANGNIRPDAGSIDRFEGYLLG